MARCNAKFCELTDANFGIGDNFQSPSMRDDDRENRRFFQDQSCLCTLNCLSFVDVSAFLLTSLALKVQTTREEELKSTLVVDNDSVHTDTACFQSHSLDPPVLSHSQMRTLRSRKRFHGI